MANGRTDVEKAIQRLGVGHDVPWRLSSRTEFVRFMCVYVCAWASPASMGFETGPMWNKDVIKRNKRAELLWTKFNSNTKLIWRINRNIIAFRSRSWFVFRRLNCQSRLVNAQWECVWWSSRVDAHSSPYDISQKSTFTHSPCPVCHVRTTLRLTSINEVYPVWNRIMIWLHFAKSFIDHKMLPINFSWQAIFRCISLRKPRQPSNNCDHLIN